MLSWNLQRRHHAPTLIDGREVSLILLHQIVTVKGVKKVIEDDLWAEVAVEYGFEVDDAHVIKNGGTNALVADGTSTRDAQAVESEDEADLVITIEVAGNDDG
ncbi:putative transcription factor & chromatin remodeling ARID family [Helianthus anomalus]